MITTRTRVMAGLACVVGIALATATTSMASLIANGSFEDEVAPGFPTGWSQNLPAGATIQTSDAYAESGIQSLAIDSTGAGAWSVPDVYQTFSASEGETFTLSGWMLTPDPIANNSFGLLKIVFRDASANDLVPAAVTIGVLNTAFPGAESDVFLNSGSPVGDWIFGQTQAVAPANTETVSFFLLNVNDVGGAVMHFDSIVAVPEPTSLALLGLGLLGMKGLRRRK